MSETLMKEVEAQLSPATFRRWKRAARSGKDIPCNVRTQKLKGQFMAAMKNTLENESDESEDEERRASWSEERVEKHRKYLADASAVHLRVMTEQTARIKKRKIDDLKKRYNAEREEICQEAVATDKKDQHDFEAATKAIKGWSPPWIRPVKDYNPSVYTPRPEDREDDPDQFFEVERFRTGVPEACPDALPDARPQE